MTTPDRTHPNVTLAVLAVGGLAYAMLSSLAAPGVVKLRIKSKGKKKRKLNDRRKVTVKVNVTFAPSASDVPVAPGSETKRLKLVKKR